MEKLEIYLDESSDFSIDNSCILAFWEIDPSKPQVYDTEFEKVWNYFFSNITEEDFSLDSPLYFDENCEHETGYTSWNYFWENIENDNCILIEVNVPHNNNWDNETIYLWHAYFINKLKISELLGEDFQANEEWIKSKFQLKTTPKS